MATTYKTLLDRSSKHSILGEGTPFGDELDGAMANTKGQPFADFRNVEFPHLSDPEPEHADINLPTFDSVLENLLVSDYTYNTGGEPQYSVTVPKAPSRGGTADLYDIGNPQTNFGTFGKYDGVDKGPTNGFYH